MMSIHEFSWTNYINNLIYINGDGFIKYLNMSKLNYYFIKCNNVDTWIVNFDLIERWGL